MLLLWDHVIEPRGGDLDRLGRAELCEIACRTIESTAGLFEPPFVEFFPFQAGNLAESSIAYCKNARPEWRIQSSAADELFSQFDSLPKVPIRPGVGPFLMAIQRLIEGLAGSVDSDVTLEIMSACYEAILMSQLTGRVTLQMQEDNGPCRAAIQLQENLIAEYAIG